MVGKKEKAVLHISHNIVFCDELRTVSLVSHDDKERFIFFADSAEDFCERYDEFNDLLKKYNVIASTTQKAANSLVRNTIDSHNYSQKLFAKISGKRPALIQFRRLSVNCEDSERMDELYLDAMLHSTIFEKDENFNETFSESRSAAHCLLVYIEKEEGTGEIKKAAIYDARSQRLIFNERFVTSQHDVWKAGRGKMLSDVVINRHYAEREGRIKDMLKNRYAIVIERVGNVVLAVVRNEQTGENVSEYKHLSLAELNKKTERLVKDGIISDKDLTNMLKTQMLTKKQSFLSDKRSRRLENRAELLK